MIESVPLRLRWSGLWPFPLASDSYWLLLFFPTTASPSHTVFTSAYTYQLLALTLM